MRTMIGGLCSLILIAAPAVAGHTKEVHKTIAIAANGRVSVETHNGSITVTAWNQPTVAVDARIEEGEWMHSHAEDVDATNVDVTGGGASVSIVSDYDRVPTHSAFLGFGTERVLPLVHYMIRVPASVSVTVRDHNANTRITGLRGDVVIRSHNGSATLRGVGGSTDVATHNGDVDIEFAGFARPSRIETHNGDVTVAMPSVARFSVESDSHRSHAVDSDFPMTVRRSHGIFTGEVNGGGPELKFVTHNGSLRLRRL